MGLAEGASSSSAGNTGLGAGGAKSHAYVQYPPLRCDIPGAAGVMYDDGNKLLLVPAPNKVIPPPSLTWTAFEELHSSSITRGVGHDLVVCHENSVSWGNEPILV